MSNLSQWQRMIAVLKEHPLERMNSRQIAEMMISKYPEDYAEKRSNPRFPNENAFITQVSAEIGTQTRRMLKGDKHVFIQDKPRPRVFWYDPDTTRDQFDEQVNEGVDDEDEIVSNETAKLSEHDLYPILMSYLKSELGLYCQRIDEKKSRNTRGRGGNQWLHPDIVAMQPVDKEWHPLVKSCVKEGSGQRVRLWSFEVKKDLKSSNARESYFQAVSNSSWANEGYLVATSISTSVVEQELRMLSALHGIGVILLNPENPTESDMILPARSRAEVDWQSANRLVDENKDFREYIEQVSTYYQTGRLRSKDWNRL